jgi:hypothetical protein
MPAGVQTSVEFQSACPASAVIMATDINRRAAPRGVPGSSG